MLFPKLLKKQEQTLKDLRVTLQRELKVQALPNDEAPEPSLNSAQSTTTGRASSPGFYNSSSSSLSSSISQQHQNHHNIYQHHHHPHSNMNQSNYGHGNSSSPSSQSFHPSSSTNPSAAVLAVQSSAPAYSGSSTMVSLTAQSPSVPSGAQDSLTAHTTSVKRDLDKDVNFMYLKHVVLKFMLSREAEVSKLLWLFLKRLTGKTKRLLVWSKALLELLLSSILTMYTEGD